ncbi:Methionine ABC transporter ATP-binding protein [Burkholderiales bacterium]|nr:Methionine ABC transporter ATP-binding protein [Burkholderiales bacterium]
MAGDCVIELRGVWTQIGANTIHRDINLCVHVGEVLALIGESGSGKTTLLRLMLGLGQPTRGTVRVFERPLQGCPADDLKRVRQRWGVLFQEGALFSALSAYDNVALPLRELRALPEEVIRELVMTKLALVEIEAASADKLPSQLSGGMVKRVALARALALDPELLFLDEPTAGLDPERSAGFVQLVVRLRQELRLTVLMVTHDVDTLIALAGRVAVLADQRLVTIGALWDVVDFPHPFVRSFFLGHRKRCAKENVEQFRRALAHGRQAA